MSKDIIFIDKPPINPLKEHLKINRMLEKMKDQIRNCVTVSEAIDTLIEKYGFFHNIFIMTAVRETFQLSYEQVSKLF